VLWWSCWGGGVSEGVGYTAFVFSDGSGVLGTVIEEPQFNIKREIGGCYVERRKLGRPDFTAPLELSNSLVR